MFTDHPKTRVTQRFFLFLMVGLGISLACRLTPSFGTPEAVNTKLPSATEPFPTDAINPATSEPIQTTPNQITAAPHPLEWQNNWLHFGVDCQFSSYNPNETRITRENVASLQQVGGLGCNDAVFSVYGGTPALYHGRIIITYAGGQLESGDPFTGNMSWHFGEHAYGWAPPPVVSTDGIIYYLYVTPDASAKLYAVNAETGQKIWEAPTQFKTGFNNEAQVTVDEKNGLVYIIEDMFGDGRLYALERSTGEIKWFLGDKRQEQEKMTFVGSFVPLMADKLYVPAAVPIEHSKRLHMVRVDPTTQALDLQYDIPKELNLSWEVGWYGICNSHLLETYQDSSRKATLLVAHTLDQPGITWQINVPGQSGRLACDTQKDLVYLPTDDGLLALEANTGKIVWNHKSIKSVFTPTIANGILYYISDTNMYALDQANGSQLFRYPLGTEGDASTGVAVNDGLVVFSGSGGTCDLIVLGLK
ncbi:MAG: PQQ-binding-like beta-propeller repeat protein [Anaerolineaceae bacterium]|nr:PQQ-binding-like beta-propeller repeat protein [Anaerolineaceae bacterium]